jgi:hypothetical protein
VAIFKPGGTIETEENVITVEPNPDAPLPPGRHVFQLVVVDDMEQSSEPAFAEVIIRDGERPTAVLDAPRFVEAGQEITLRGERSSDVEPGKIVRYAWTLLDQIR